MSNFRNQWNKFDCTANNINLAQISLPNISMIEENKDEEGLRENSGNPSDSSPSDSQKRDIALWVNEGLGLSEIQKRINEDFGIVPILHLQEQCLFSEESEGDESDGFWSTV